jgi:hypothetical protein
VAVVVVKQNNNNFHPPYGPDGPLPPRGAEVIKKVSHFPQRGKKVLSNNYLVFSLS